MGRPEPEPEPGTLGPWADAFGRIVEQERRRARWSTLAATLVGVSLTVLFLVVVWAAVVLIVRAVLGS